MNNLSFSEDLLNRINNRNKKNSLKKSDFVTNNDLGKRKFSTLNLNKQNNKLDFLKKYIRKTKQKLITVLENINI
jgi:hypothetical protein